MALRQGVPSRHAFFDRIGRQRQLVTFGCSRLAAELSRSAVGRRERPPSQTLICSTAAKVEFQSRPVVRSESHHGLLWVVSGHLAQGDNLEPMPTCPGREPIDARTRTAKRSEMARSASEGSPKTTTLNPCPTQSPSH